MQFDYMSTGGFVIINSGLHISSTSRRSGYVKNMILFYQPQLCFHYTPVSAISHPPILLCFPCPPVRLSLFILVCSSFSSILLMSVSMLLIFALFTGSWIFTCLDLFAFLLTDHLGLVPQWIIGFWTLFVVSNPNTLGRELCCKMDIQISYWNHH